MQLCNRGTDLSIGQAGLGGPRESSMAPNRWMLQRVCTSHASAVTQAHFGLGQAATAPAAAADHAAGSALPDAAHPDGAARSGGGHGVTPPGAIACDAMGLPWRVQVASQSTQSILFKTTPKDCLWGPGTTPPPVTIKASRCGLAGKCAVLFPRSPAPLAGQPLPGWICPTPGVVSQCPERSASGSWAKKVRKKWAFLGFQDSISRLRGQSASADPGGGGLALPSNSAWPPPPPCGSWTGSSGRGKRPSRSSWALGSAGGRVRPRPSA